MKHILILTLLLSLFGAAACAPRSGDPAKFPTPNQEREQQLLGTRELTQANPTPSSTFVPTATQTTRADSEDGLLHPPLFELTSNQNDAQHKVNLTARQDYVVELLDIQPPRKTTDPIPLEQYVATFRVTHNAPTPTRGAARTVTAAPPNGFPTGKLDEPFTTRMFQTIAVPEAEMQVTLITRLEDSRCPRSVNCFQAGRAVLGFALERGERLALLNLSTMPPDGRTRAYFQGYVLELLALTPYPTAQFASKEIAPEEYEATFVVRKFAAAGPTQKATASTQSACAGLTPADAESILGEAVQPEMSTQIILRAAQEDSWLTDDAYGLCGYVSKRVTFQNQKRLAEPQIESPSPADYAVNAGQISGAICRAACPTNAKQLFGDSSGGERRDEGSECKRSDARVGVTSRN